MIRLLKLLLPDRPVPMRVWRGPFRGARVVMNPRTSLRKVTGLYEHELNDWLESALAQVNRVLDVGANDGYFTFGCAAALQRRNITAEIIAFEPQARHARQLRAAAALMPGVRIEVVEAMVHGRTAAGQIALDDLPIADRTRTLIKLDVEGAEEAVLEGAQSWLTPTNHFVIEVHDVAFIEPIRATFSAKGLHLRLIEQRPLWLLGRETRERDNCWLVSSPPPA